MSKCKKEERKEGLKEECCDKYIKKGKYCRRCPIPIEARK